MEIAEIAKEFVSGQKLYQQRAIKVLPILVRQAQAAQKIYYSDLATEINIPNPRNLNYVLGSIGNALIKLGESMKIEIPPIQCLVVNKHTELPGEGISWFIKDVKEFKKLNSRQKKAVLDNILAKIYAFAKWNEVLEQLGLKPIGPEGVIESIVKKATSRGSVGESIHHKELKEQISKNPQIIGVNLTPVNVEVEYLFPSADTMDISFKNKNHWIGAEVKSHISDDADILRGLYQCVKYKSLMEAHSNVMNETTIKEIRVILALGGEFPDSLMPVKNILGVEVIDNIEQLNAPSESGS
jgi:hypothetical protein